MQRRRSWPCHRSLKPITLPSGTAFVMPTSPPASSAVAGCARARPVAWARWVLRVDLSTWVRDSGAWLLRFATVCMPLCQSDILCAVRPLAGGKGREDAVQRSVHRCASWPRGHGFEGRRRRRSNPPFGEGRCFHV